MSNYTFCKAAIIVLLNNDNGAMTPTDIWQYAKFNRLLSTRGVSPENTMGTQIRLFSRNSNINKTALLKINPNCKYYFEESKNQKNIAEFKLTQSFLCKIALDSSKHGIAKNILATSPVNNRYEKLGLVIDQMRFVKPVEQI